MKPTEFLVVETAEERRENADLEGLFVCFGRTHIAAHRCLRGRRFACRICVQILHIGGDHSIQYVLQKKNIYIYISSEFLDN